MSKNTIWYNRQMRDQHLNDARVALEHLARSFAVNHVKFAKQYHRKLMELLA